MTQFVTAAEAVKLIKDNDTLAVGGFVGFSVPEELLKSLEKNFLDKASPRNLNIFGCAGVGDKNGRGMDHLAHEGLVGKLCCAFLGLAPKLGRMASDNKFPAHTVPQGVTVHMLKAIAAQKPGVITNVGLKTFADPRQEGCRANKAAEGESVVELIHIHNKEYLFYKSIPIDVCFIRATTADENGNLSFEKEAVRVDQLAMAMATRNSGGIVIAQTERVCKCGSLKAADVGVHNYMVDYVIVASPKNHTQSFKSNDYIPEWSGEVRGPDKKFDPVLLDPKKVIGRRASYELKKGSLTNLGIGVPEYVAVVAGEEGVYKDVILTIESGVMGGVPVSGLGIGATYNPDAIHLQDQMFDFYDGGGIDTAFLGAAQIDECGNVNVSKFGGRVVGPGGFVNISQNSRKVVYCGTFTTGGFKAEVGEGTLKIIQEGKNKKFINTLEQITFSAENAIDCSQEVLYVTERAVFRLTNRGLLLIEIAPGIDLEKDILQQMEFIPTISDNLKKMDRRIFIDQPMKLEIN